MNLSLEQFLHLAIRDFHHAHKHRPTVLILHPRLLADFVRDLPLDLDPRTIRFRGVKLIPRISAIYPYLQYQNIKELL